MPPSVQGTQHSWLYFVITINWGTLPGATLVVGGFPTCASKLWPLGTWGRAIPVSDLCLDPVNFHSHVTFHSGTLQHCSHLLTHPHLRKKGRISLQTKPVTVSLLCSMSHLATSFPWPVISRTFKKSISEMPWPSTGLLGHYASVNVWNLLLFWKHFPPWVCGISLPYLAFSFYLWVFSC